MRRRLVRTSTAAARTSLRANGLCGLTARESDRVEVRIACVDALPPSDWSDAWARLLPSSDPIEMVEDEVAAAAHRSRLRDLAQALSRAARDAVADAYGPRRRATRGRWVLARRVALRIADGWSLAAAAAADRVTVRGASVALWSTVIPAVLRMTPVSRGRTV